MTLSYPNKLEVPTLQLEYNWDISNQPCSNCNYECMSGQCKYRDDGIYSLFENFTFANKVFFVVTMYCSNPSALYFILNERCQDFFMNNEHLYEEWVDKLYVIGVYGSKREYPEFLKLFIKQYGFLV